MQTNKYSHLDVAKFNNDFDWQNKMFVKSLPPKAFVNAFTAGFLMSVQKIMVIGFEQAHQIKTYFRF